MAPQTDGIPNESRFNEVVPALQLQVAQSLHSEVYTSALARSLSTDRTASSAADEPTHLTFEPIRRVSESPMINQTASQPQLRLEPMIDQTASQPALRLEPMIDQTASQPALRLEPMIDQTVSQPALRLERPMVSQSSQYGFNEQPYEDGARLRLQQPVTPQMSEAWAALDRFNAVPQPHEEIAPWQISPPYPYRNPYSAAQSMGYENIQPQAPHAESQYGHRHAYSTVESYMQQHHADVAHNPAHHGTDEHHQLANHQAHHHRRHHHDAHHHQAEQVAHEAHHEHHALISKEASAHHDGNNVPLELARTVVSGMEAWAHLCKALDQVLIDLKGGEH